MKEFIAKIISFTSDFIKNELKDKKRLFFWIPFIILFIVFLILFIVFSVSLIGWLLLLIIFILSFVFRFKILTYTLIIQIVIGVVILTLLLISMLLNKGDYSSSNVSKTPLEELSYNNKYDMLQGFGNYEINLVTNKEDNIYELELIISANTSIIPSDFIWDSTKCDTYIRENITIYETDQLEIFITSNKKDNDYYSHGALSVMSDFSSGYGKITGVAPTKFTFSFNSKEKLKKFIEEYNEFEVYRYNIGEVGINDFKSEKSDLGGYTGSYGYNAEKAYKLHPVIVEQNIDWEELNELLGLK